MAKNLCLVVIWAISAFLSDMSKNIKMELNKRSNVFSSFFFKSF